MIGVTGGAGFIGSCLITKLIDEGYADLVIVDDFSNSLKTKNLANKDLAHQIDREDFFSWIDKNHKFIQFIFHIGARTDTTEFDIAVFDKLNLNYSKSVWEKCSNYGIPLVYASSAATYGSGESGYSDDHELVKELKPLNPYGNSKNEFDKWALAQERRPFFWTGLKFFNVYGPGEYHKGRMASVVFHAWRQIKQTGRVRLFRSHRPDYRDGEQRRDFIYVKDAAGVMLRMMQTRKNPGIYNLGTGKAETFLSLAGGVFRALELEPDIEFIDTPEDIRETYQYFTEAKMDKLISAGYGMDFTGLEEGILDYVRNYLEHDSVY